MHRNHNTEKLQSLTAERTHTFDATNKAAHGETYKTYMTALMFLFWAANKLSGSDGDSEKNKRRGGWATNAPVETVECFSTTTVETAKRQSNTKLHACVSGANA